jgi:hypothetical protein
MKGFVAHDKDTLMESIGSAKQIRGLTRLYVILNDDGHFTSYLFTDNFQTCFFYNSLKGRSKKVGIPTITVRGPKQTKPFCGLYALWFVRRTSELENLSKKSIEQSIKIKGDKDKTVNEQRFELFRKVEDSDRIYFPHMYQEAVVDLVSSDDDDSDKFVIISSDDEEEEEENTLTRPRKRKTSDKLSNPAVDKKSRS